MSGGTSELDRAAYATRVASVSIAEHLAVLDRVCPWYGHFLRPWLPDDPAARLIDVPCGGGNLLYALKRLGYTNVLGVDGDALQVEIARALQLPAELRDAFEALEAERSGSVDRVFSLDFLEHVEKERAVEFCRLARNRLNDKGMLLLRTPSADGPFGSADRYNDITHRWGVTSGAAVQLLRLAGFQPGDVEVVQESPVPYKWQNRLRLAAFKATTSVVGAWLSFTGIGAPRVWTRSMWVVARKRV